MTPTTWRLDLAYAGGGFSGWASQPGARTVQGELELALERLFGDSPRLTVAGRTDAGVHAWGQVASFETASPGPEELVRSLNAMTGDDLAVLGAARRHAGFDARRAAKSRTYCYRVLAASVPSPFQADFSLYWPHPLDVGLLKEAAESVVGEHDFTAFTPTQTDHVRFERSVLGCEWRSTRPDPDLPGQVLELWIEADAFMRNMVRALVGTMLEVGGGRRSPEDFASLLSGAPREAGGPTAPPHGLHLASVSY